MSCSHFAADLGRKGIAPWGRKSTLRAQSVPGMVAVDNAELKAKFLPNIGDPSTWHAEDMPLYKTTQADRL